MAGAIFARGSCRALRWMALFGVVFALGGGQAAAQGTIRVTLGTSTPVEGGALVPVSVSVTAGASDVAGDVVTVTLTLAADIAAELDERGDLGGADQDVSWEGKNRADADSADLTFTVGANGTVTPSVRVVNLTTYTDDDAEDEKFVITAGATSSGSGGHTQVGTAKFTIGDIQDQTYVLRNPFSNVNELKEGDSLLLDPLTGGNAFVLELRPAKSVDTSFRVNLASVNDSSDYALNPTVVTAAISELFNVPAADARVIVPFSSRDNDGDRIDDTITITVWTTTGTTAVQVLEEPLEIHRPARATYGGDRWHHDGGRQEGRACFAGADLGGRRAGDGEARGRPRHGR